MPGDDGEAALVRLVAAGDQEAFAQLTRRYYGRLYRMIYRLRGPGRAEEIMQEVLLRFFLAAPRYKGRGALFTWLYRIALNLCRDDARREMRERAAIFGWRSLVRLAPAGQATTGGPGGGGRGAGATPLLVIEPSSLPPEEIAYDGVESGVATRDAVRRALLSLKVEQRAVVLLHDMEGMTHEEIASVLGCPVGTVKSRLWDARRRLRRALAAGEDGAAPGTRSGGEGQRL